MDHEEDDESLMLLLTILQFIYAFGLMLITCELGQYVYDAFEECSDMILQLDWYLFPAKVLRTLLIIINFAQQPTVFECFGSIASIRETFKYVRIDRIADFING